jgi:hypothetical protein
LCGSTYLFLATPPLEPAPYREMKIQILVRANNSSGIQGNQFNHARMQSSLESFILNPLRTNAQNKRSFLP